jgi:hypothetical protein
MLNANEKVKDIIDFIKPCDIVFDLGAGEGEVSNYISR